MRGRRGGSATSTPPAAQITDEAKLERIASLAIPPAWKDVWIAPTRAREAAGDRRRRRRAQAVPLPPGFPRPAGAGEVRQADPLRRAPAAAARGDGRAHGARGAAAGAGRRDRRPADQPRLVPRRHRPLRKTSRTFGITTLRKRHVTVRGSRISFKYRGKHQMMIRSAIVDRRARGSDEGAARRAGRAPLPVRGRTGAAATSSSRRLNDYIREHMGEEFTAKDFRTWGGTLTRRDRARRARPRRTARPTPRRRSPR